MSKVFVVRCADRDEATSTSYQLGACEQPAATALREENLIMISIILPYIVIDRIDRIDRIVSDRIGVATVDRIVIRIVRLGCLS